jgi:hypothetical protein
VGGRSSSRDRERCWRSDAELSDIARADAVGGWAKIGVFKGRLVEKPGVAAGEDVLDDEDLGRFAQILVGVDGEVSERSVVESERV